MMRPSFFYSSQELLLKILVKLTNSDYLMELHPNCAQGQDHTVDIERIWSTT